MVDLNPEHISIYSLILEEGTKLQKMVSEGKVKLPEEDIERKMYWKAKEILEEHGYIHYEISNFAKNMYRSKHNINCWEQKEYIGFGVAAHSYLNNTRYSNIEDIEKYINNIKNGEIDKNIIIHKIQKKEEKAKEYMLLGLRKIEGLNIDKYKEKFGKNPIVVYNKELRKLDKENLIKVEGKYIKLTDKGLDLANIVWQEFV